MKPIIGICTNYSPLDELGLMTKLGLPGQEWQLLADDYIKGIERGGGVPVIIPILEQIENIVPLLGCLDGIVFTGGQDIEPRQYGQNAGKNLGTISPERDSQEIALAKKALYEMEIPVLGICRGHQILNVAAGGTLYSDIETQRVEAMNHTCFHAPKHHRAHEAEVLEGTRMKDIFGQEILGINSYHHQAIDRMGEGFKVSMVAGDGIVEAMEYPGERFVVSVQWHPEMMVDRCPEYLKLFSSFVASCKKEIKRTCKAV